MSWIDVYVDVSHSYIFLQSWQKHSKPNIFSIPQHVTPNRVAFKRIRCQVVLDSNSDHTNL